MPRSNKFIRARHHLSSTQIDERISALNEGPTNNTSGYYVIEPDVVTVTPAVRSDLDLTADDPALNGTDTSGLFDSNGDPLSEMPPGDTSFILGPMVSVHFPDGDYSAIGYIQKDTRKVINLARIPGTVSQWGIGGNTEGFTSYSQLTLEQALWYRDKLINGNTSTYRVFYIGVFEQLNSEKGTSISDPSTGVDVDEYNRWNAEIIDQGQILEPERTEVTPGKKGPDPDMPPGIANPYTDIIKNAILGAMATSLGGGTDLIKKLFDLKQGVPALDYSVDIAISVLTGKPMVYNQSDINPRHIEALINNISPSQIGTTIKINDKEVPYADDNFITDANGNVRPRNKFPTKPDGTTYSADEIRNDPKLLAQANAWDQDQKNYPNNTAPMTSNDPGFAGLGNPLHAAGQAQAQIVVPKDGSEPYFKYVDHAYHNTQSTDPGEVPDPVKAGLSDLVHSFAGHGYGNDTSKPNTGPMSGYPPGIRGDVIKTFTVPVSQLPPSVQNAVNQSIGRPAPKNVPGIGRPGPVLGFRPNIVKPARPTTKESFEKENRRRILNDVKKPYFLPEVKGEKVKHRPKVIGAQQHRVVGDSMMKKAEVPTSFKRLEDNIWKKQDRVLNARYSQERKNMILDSIGTSDHAWNWMTEKNHTRSEKSMYENFGGGQKNQIISKKKVGNDYVVKMYNEEGKVEILTQSVLNEKLQKQYEIREQETLNAPNDPLVKRVRKALSTKIDYEDKPSKKGYPDQPVLPVGGDGYHLEYGNKKDYYKKLDLHSADSMDNVRTGNFDIDQQVFSQTTAEKIKKIMNNKKKNK